MHILPFDKIYFGHFPLCTIFVKIIQKDYPREFLFILWIYLLIIAISINIEKLCLLLLKAVLVEKKNFKCQKMCVSYIYVFFHALVLKCFKNV